MNEGMWAEDLECFSRGARMGVVLVWVVVTCFDVVLLLELLVLFRSIKGIELDRVRSCPGRRDKPDPPFDPEGGAKGIMGVMDKKLKPS